MTPHERLEQAATAGPTSCWIWPGSLVTGGYGVVTVERVRLLAHRWSWSLANGPIPEGLVMDHLCRNRGCVNPDHLEAVTQRVNTVRGEGPGGRNARKTHCKHGHEFTDENTYLDRLGNRKCRECIRNQGKTFRAKNPYRKAKRTST